MLDIQRLADIACRHETAMADALLAACVERALRTGERLRPRRRESRARGRSRPEAEEDVDWEALVRGNRCIRSLFVGGGARA